MTTYVPFVPPSDAPFSFNATLDGSQYTVTVLFNIYSQRRYVQVADQYGNVIFLVPMIESPPLSELASISWAAGITSGLVTAVAQSPLPYPIGSIANLTVYGASPSAYNGLNQCVIATPYSFTYPLASNPGVATAAGAWTQDIPINAGYFVTSTLVWRPDTGTFEVNP